MKGGTALFAITIVLLLATPTGIAPPAREEAPAPNQGLERACEMAKSPRPCDHLRVIVDDTVEPGESDSYNGTWTSDRTVTVQPGGTLVIEDATVRFTAESGGIFVQPGGTLRILRSTLEPRAGDETTYVLDLAAGSSFTLNDSTVRAGHGVKLRTSDANISGNLLTEIPLALHMIDVVEVTVHHNHFLDNEVAVNQTGGVTTLDSNFFQGGETCVRDWLADPTIVDNVFRGCHTGIWHEQSNSVFLRNDMEDDAHEPGTGILVMNTNSPIIEDNVVRNYGTGILVLSATAYIRNNTVSDNVLDGIRVVGNSQIMDIHGNVITGNGGDGIHLVDAQGIDIAGNEISGNGGSGVRVEGSIRIELAGDGVFDNGEHGLVLSDSNVGVTDVNATGNAQDGIRFAGPGAYSLLRANASANGDEGFEVAATGASVELLSATAMGNTGHGLLGRNGTTADGGWWEANGGAGVANLDADYVLPSTCSYWGSSSGPTHADNPGGTGDEVLGNVDYTPFRTSPAQTSCTPILIVEDTYIG